MFHFPGTAALLLRNCTWMSDVAITNTIRRRLQDGEPFTILTTRGGNHHYFVRPANGGFYITPTQLPTGFMK